MIAIVTTTMENSFFILSRVRHTKQREKRDFGNLLLMNFRWQSFAVSHFIGGKMLVNLTSTWRHSNSFSPTVFQWHFNLRASHDKRQDFVEEWFEETQNWNPLYSNSFTHSQWSFNENRNWSVSMTSLPPRRCRRYRNQIESRIRRRRTREEEEYKHTHEKTTKLKCFEWVRWRRSRKHRMCDGAQISHLSHLKIQLFGIFRFTQIST